MTTQHTGPLASLVAELRAMRAHTYSSENADEYRAFDRGIEIAADRIEKLIAEMCDVALESCFGDGEWCGEHVSPHDFSEPGKFTQREAN